MLVTGVVHMDNIGMRCSGSKLCQAVEGQHWLYSDFLKSDMSHEAVSQPAGWHLTLGHSTDMLYIRAPKYLRVSVLAKFTSAHIDTAFRQSICVKPKMFFPKLITPASHLTLHKECIICQATFRVSTECPYGGNRTSREFRFSSDVKLLLISK